jgi:hypothetical protein
MHACARRTEQAKTPDYFRNKGHRERTRALGGRTGTVPATPPPAGESACTTARCSRSNPTWQWFGSARKGRAVWSACRSRGRWHERACRVCCAGMNAVYARALCARACAGTSVCARASAQTRPDLFSHGDHVLNGDRSPVEQAQASERARARRARCPHVD